MRISFPSSGETKFLQAEAENSSSFEQPFQALSSTGFLESLTWTCRFLTRRRTLKNAADMGEINFVVVVYSRRIYVRMIRNSSAALLHFGTRGMIICWMRLTYKLTSLPLHAPSSMHPVIPRYAPLCPVMPRAIPRYASLSPRQPRYASSCAPSFLVIANIRESGIESVT